jgi:hypothetical protein
MGFDDITSPSRRRILKLRLLIFNWGEPGKQNRQFVKEYMRSVINCAMISSLGAGLQGWGSRKIAKIGGAVLKKFGNTLN